MLRTRLYRSGRLASTDFPIEDVSDHLDEPDTVVWIDMVDPGRPDLDVVAHELALHTLALDDAVGDRQRPKLDRYPEHLYLAAYHVRLDRDSGQLAAHEVGAFITPRALVTVHDEQFPIDDVCRRWDNAPELAGHGVAALLYGLLDVVVDSHFDVVRALDDELDELEDMLFDDRAHGSLVQRRTFELRKSVVLLRRVVHPMREVVGALLRRDRGLELVTAELLPYYQDVYDHVLRATEWTESLRDLLVTVLDTHLTIQGNRLNTVMKKVTGWAAIIAVPTAVTGYYGQNVPYPGFSQPSGFWASTVLIVVLSGLLYVVFRARDWI